MEGRRGGTGCASADRQRDAAPGAGLSLSPPAAPQPCGKGPAKRGQGPERDAAERAENGPVNRLPEAHGVRHDDRARDSPQDGAEDRCSGSGECHSGEKPLTLLTGFIVTVIAAAGCCRAALMRVSKDSLRLAAPVPRGAPVPPLRLGVIPQNAVSVTVRVA